jgi:hypothetical protein
MDGTEESKGAARPCPGCGYPENPLEDRFCGRCSASLERALVRSGDLVPRTKESGVRLSRFLPGRLGPVGKTVAASLAVAAADVGLAWLRHRLENTERPAQPHDIDRPWREAVPRSGPEYLHDYFFKETVLLLREGRETRRSYSSELTIRSTRVEK